MPLPLPPRRSAAPAPKRRGHPIKQGEARFGFAMIGLAVLFVAVFTAIPIVASLVLSFFSWDVISPPEFIGLENYQRMLDDGPVLKSFGVTLGMALRHRGAPADRRTRPGRAGERPGPGLAAHRSSGPSFYLPLLASSAAVSIFMGYLFDYKFGVVNYYLGLIGISNVPWLTSGFGAAVTIVLITVWQQTGFTFVLFVAALMAVPTDVLEASQIDGAGRAAHPLRIKIPLISPTILFAAVVALINAMQLFDQPYIMTKGGPGTATTTVTIADVPEGLPEPGVRLRLGHRHHPARWSILAITGLQFLAARKLVFYQ